MSFTHNFIFFSLDKTSTRRSFCPQLRNKEETATGLKGLKGGLQKRDRGHPRGNQFWLMRHKAEKARGKSLVNPSSFLSRDKETPFQSPRRISHCVIGAASFFVVSADGQVVSREPLWNRMNCFEPGRIVDWWNRWIDGLWLKFDVIDVSCLSLSRSWGMDFSEIFYTFGLVPDAILQFCFVRTLSQRSHLWIKDQHIWTLSSLRLCYPSQEKEGGGGDPWMNSFAKTEKWLPGGIEERNNNQHRSFRIGGDR